MVPSLNFSPLSELSSISQPPKNRTLSARLGALAFCGSADFGFAERPAINLHVNHSANFNSFAFQQTPLLCGIRLGNANVSAGAKHAMPGNASPVGGRGHRIAHGTRATRQTQRLSYLAIGCYASTRDFFHQTINRIPGHSAPFSANYQWMVFSIKVTMTAIIRTPLAKDTKPRCFQLHARCPPAKKRRFATNNSLAAF